MPSSPVALGDKVDLVIERLALGGAGVSRYQGFVIFVPFTAPQDEVRVEITEVKRSFASARLLQILKPGSKRALPPCPVFGRCGGCTWQHVEYDEQLAQKQTIVEQLLKREPRLKDVEVHPIVPSPHAWAYRNRIQLRVGQGRLGFYERHTHEIADTSHCFISEDALNLHLASVRARFAKSDRIRKVELFLNSTGEILESIDQPHGEYGFEQVNRLQNQNMIHVVVETLKSSGGPVLDLYSGQGNFTFALAEALPKQAVTGVERNPHAVKKARERLNTLSHLKPRLRFVQGDVKLFLTREPSAPSEQMVIDPPRVGCEPEVISALRERRPDRIIYVSCNPATFVRDAARLMDVFQLTHVRPFDMFPQTDHVELVGMFV